MWRVYIIQNSGHELLSMPVKPIAVPEELRRVEEIPDIFVRNRASQIFRPSE